MRTVLLAIILATGLAYAVDLKHVDIKTPEDIAAIAAIPEWRRGADTNGITISVCVGTAIGYRNGSPNSGFHLAREMTFDADGRLIYVSKICTIPAADDNVKSLDDLRRRLFPTAAEKKEDEENARLAVEIARSRRSKQAITSRARTRHTPAQPTGQYPSEKPSADGR